jgi:two-component system sensor histidine kinase VicK
MLLTTDPEKYPYPFLENGGEMGSFIRAIDWSNNPLGMPGQWPVVLKHTVSIMLRAAFPMLICWGDDYTQLYNDAFRPINGTTKHPDAIGGSAKDTYAEIWPIIAPMFSEVMAGKTHSFKNFMVPLNRKGYLEDCYFDFSYSPIADEQGTIGGLLVVCTETTERRLTDIETQRLSDDLNALNEEMISSNESLIKLNHDLENAQEELKATFSQLEESEIALRLAINAANFGTWYINSVTRTFVTDVRLRQLFGYRPDEEITIEDALAQISEDYRGYVANKLENAIYKGGDYDVTYPVTGFHDNVLRWLRAIGNLKADRSGEFSAFTGVVMDVTEQKQDEQRKNDFIGMVSHELKTPVTSLSAYLQVLHIKARKAADEFTVNALDKSLRQVKKMTTMINGFLDVSRLESGKIYIDKTRFDMAALVHDVEQETTVMITSHNIVFHPVEPTWVCADKDKIGQVINNFITNAVKYSKPGSMIQVACITVNGFAQVRVSDEGIGINENDLSQLFERYYRVENSNTVSGFGIGLYVCSEIIKRHDGKIWAESKPGAGSSFYFTLPLEQPDA